MPRTLCRRPPPPRPPSCPGRCLPRALWTRRGLACGRMQDAPWMVDMLSVSFAPSMAQLESSRASWPPSVRWDDAKIPLWGSLGSACRPGLLPSPSGPYWFRQRTRFKRYDPFSHFWRLQTKTKVIHVPFSFCLLKYFIENKNDILEEKIQFSVIPSKNNYYYQLTLFSKLFFIVKKVSHRGTVGVFKSGCHVYNRMHNLFHQPKVVE